VLLDRPMPESGAGLARTDVPRLAGLVAVYGRQTDRPERLELTVDRGSAFEATIRAVQDVAGGALGEMIEERVIGSVSPTDQALNWRWHLPRDTSPDDRRRLIAEERRAAITERWPDLPKPVLAGKSPRQAAGDPQLRIPLMAAVLILEQGSNSDRDAEAVAQLRSELGLPQPDAIEPGEPPAAALPLVRVSRLKIDALTDDDLVILYTRAVLVGANSAIAILAREAVRRPSIAARIPPSDSYRRLIAIESDPSQALALINAAREQSQSAGESTAPWDLAELELHIRSGDADEAKLALARVEREHRDDPDVAAALYRLLYDTGVIPEELPEQTPAYEEPAAMTSEPAAAGSRIWTPDSDRPAGGKSSLWTPS
jgi:hypothetical protein